MFRALAGVRFGLSPRLSVPFERSIGSHDGVGVPITQRSQSCTTAREDMVLLIFDRGSRPAMARALKELGPWLAEGRR